MNNITETEQERQYRKNKNEIVGMIFLNICPVYTGKIDKTSIRSSLRMPCSEKSALNLYEPKANNLTVSIEMIVLQNVNLKK